MTWFGKIAGGVVGGLLGGPLGMIAGAALGHVAVDKNSTQLNKQNAAMNISEQKQAVYFTTLFSLLGKMAKADGKVNREEGEALKTFLNKINMPAPQRKFAIQLFNEAKDSSHSVRDLAIQFRDAVNGKYEVILSLLDMLFQIAAADNKFHPGEKRMINEIRDILNISSEDIKDLKNRYFPGEDDESYKILNCTKDSSDKEIKKNYRKMVNKFHPDKIISKELPEEFVDFSKKRFQEIQKAYEKIRKERGF